MRDAPYKIFSASAGSGKTFTLVKEYLKIVLSPEGDKNFRQILAITFTNKAVNEMKQRILESLFIFGHTTSIKEGSPLFLTLLEELQTDCETLRKRSKKVLKEILHNYAFFDVSTIDKFTYRLIRTFAKDLKISRNFEVVLDTDLLLSEAVARLIGKAGDDKKLTGILIDFALEKIDEDKSWDVAIDLNKIGKLLFDENHTAHLKKLENKGIDNFLEFRKVLLKRNGNLKRDIVKIAREILEIIDSNGLEFSDFKSGYFPKFMDKISKGGLQVDFKASWKQNFGQEPLYTKSCQEVTRSKLDALLPYFDSEFKTLKKEFFQLSFLKNIYKNLVPLTVINAIQQELKTLETERNQLPISSFNTIISDEIKSQPAPYIYERLGEKYRHYFVDEFQDTSQSQWNNLIPLIGNALESEDELGRKGSLLLVGDAKQAIYRWRGGKAEQFLNLVNLKTNPFVLPPVVKALPKNYRSHEEIVSFNNDFFKITSPFLNNKVYNDLFVEGNKQQVNPKKGGLVQLNFLETVDKSLDETYLEKVLHTIEEVRTNKFDYKDICVLTRKRKHGVLLSDFLMQAGIPIVSSETLLLKSSEKIQFLINLLKHSNNPNDMAIRYDILYFLETDKRKRHHFIQKNLGEFYTVLGELYDFDFDQVQHSSVYDSLEYAIKQFELAEKSDAYITYLMDEVLQIEQKEDVGIVTFLEYWEKKEDRLSVVAPENMNAVQIMTVHKAKGLEFPVVIFPYANTNIYEEIDPKLWLPIKSDLFQGFDEVLVNKKQEVVNYGERAKTIYEEEHHKLELDAFNLLYVALTRAINALYIISEKDLNVHGEHRTGYYSGLFIHYLKEKGLWEDNRATYSFGVLNAIGKEPGFRTIQESIPYQYTHKNRPGFKILTQGGMLWETEKEVALARGNLIHLLLEQIKTVYDIDRAIGRLLMNGNIDEQEVEVYRATIDEIVNHPQLKPFYSDGNTIRNESDIITENGLILRPDRLVIRNNKLTIIDYKTGKKNPKYHQQLFDYADALENMGYVVDNKIIVYIEGKIMPKFI